MAAKKTKPKDGDAKLRPDVNEIAFRVMREATGQSPKTPPPSERTEKNPEAVKRGRKGGAVGGHERAAELTKRRRVAIARKAAKKRWKKPRSS